MSFRPFNLTADSSCRERVPTAFQMAALIGLGASTNDASHALLHGSVATVFAKPAATSGCFLGSGPSPVRALIITALLAFASGICQAQEPSAGPLIDRWEARADRIEQRLQESTHEARRWNDFVERWESRFAKWDGSLISAFFKPLWLIVTGVYRLAWGLIAAVIAVCVARSIREVSDAIVAWKAKPT